MRALHPAELLRVWDEGDARHDIDRALVLLRFGLPERDYPWLASLPVGRRDAFLLHLRRATFGSRIVFVVLCPRCGEKLEDEASVDELLLSDPWSQQPDVFRTTSGDWELTYRLVDSRDLAAVAPLGDGGAGRALAKRCLLSARREGREVDSDELDASAWQALAAGVAKDDPQSEIEFTMNCPACRHAWPLTFDIATLFWHEVVNRAKLVLRDVAALAARYGWSEDEILTMSAARRAFYLEQVRE
jgi:hypothetical protein